MAPSAELTKSLLDCHYSGDPAARFAWLGLCEDAGIELPDCAVSGAWRGTLEAWLLGGPKLVRQYPLLKVTFVDRRPAWVNSSGRGYKWFFYANALDSARWAAGPEDLPRLFDPDNQFVDDRYPSDSEVFSSLAEALKHASSLAIQWARRESGCDST